MSSTRFLRFLLISFGLFCVVPDATDAGIIPTTKKAKLSLDGTTQTLVVDPFNVLEMQVDFEFDPARSMFIDLVAVSPYMLVSFDAGQAAMGFIRDILVTFPGPGLPPPGEVDTIEIHMQDLILGPACFRVFASDNDFIRGFDPVTMTQFVITGPFDPVRDEGIEEARLCTPEPGSMALFGLGSLWVTGFAWRQGRRAGGRERGS